MTSSTLTGERRWAPARRGGMTVLGKVAVPKPINLPSQRLENHGLDPNVEIVPKGTLSWGSRPSSAGSNAWGTSALSPSTDGSSSSSSHLAGRPSSGGGTRPSTAGSEKAHDSNTSAWGSNSRPSSASGVLASSSSSLTSRPRSAETRPGSSQLSRFAEPSAESCGPWGSNSYSQRMTMSTSGNDGFSLSSGDFPTLGSEKDEPKKDMEPQDRASHGRPGSSSGGVATRTDNLAIANDDTSRNPDFHGNSWRNDGPPYVEDGPRPSMERWHGEPHPHPNHNMAPHCESWRGAPSVNPPGGVWYRPGPPGPPYGAPGGFPMEPYPYYRPQVPAPGLANSQPGPPGAGPHGHHPKNGDIYRPHMPDSYMRPGMPIRPGFYPGPVPFEAYYGSPMGFCNPNEREMPFMGMAAGPPMYNIPVSQSTPDPNNSRPKSREGRGPDQIDYIHHSAHPHDPRGGYQVLKKQNDGWNQSDEEKWTRSMTTSAVNNEKGILSKSSVPDNAWGDDHKEEDMHHRKSSPAIGVASQSLENKFGSAHPSNAKFSARNVEEADMSPVIENVASPVDHSLIQKLEGLNAKVRSVGGRQDGFHKEDPHKKVQKVIQSASDANCDVALERHYPSGVLVPVSRDMNTSMKDKSQESTVTGVTPASRKPLHGVQSRDDHHAKGKFNAQDADDWRKKSESRAVSTAGPVSTVDIQVEKHHAVAQYSEVSKPNAERKGDGEPVKTGFDPSDSQRAKMKEIAKQRAIQRQKEEEERIQEQKAKALAKLEELNRRSANQGTDMSSQKSETISSQSTVSQTQEDSRNKPGLSSDANQSAGSIPVSSNDITESNRSTNDTVDSGIPTAHQGADSKKSSYKNSVLSRNQLSTGDVKLDDAAGNRTAPLVHEVTKQKRVGHKQRQNIPLEKNSSQDSSPSDTTSVVKDRNVIGRTEEGTSNEVASGAGQEVAEPSVVSDPLVNQKKKNKSGRNKHKVESVPVLTDSSPAQATPVLVKETAPDVSSKPAATQSSVDAKDAAQSSENHSSLSREDAHGRQNNSWKPQHLRKPRNSQGNRPSEKSHGNDAVVWAPVRPHNKVEVTEQTSQKVSEPSIPSSTVDNMASSSKTKRAEMERYVPKPAAKELAQQGSIQQAPSHPVEQAAADGKGARVKSPQGFEPKHVDGKHKQQRAQGSWRQRASVETVPPQASEDNSSGTAESSKTVQPSNSSERSLKSDESLVGGQASTCDDLLAKGPQDVVCDGWTMPDEPDAGIKDQALSGKGKKHPFKGHKGGGNSQNFDDRDSHPGATGLQRQPAEVSQASSKENRAVGDRSAHWQPKSQGGHVAHGQLGSWSQGGQNVISDDSKAFKRETGRNGDSLRAPQHSQGATRDAFPASVDKDVVGGRPSSGHQESKRDRSASMRGRTRSPNQGFSDDAEAAPHGPTDGHLEHRPSSGYRKNASYGGHYNRRPDHRGDWGSVGQENKQHQERQRRNSHYEYQPVGAYNDTGRSDDSGAPTENHAGGPRFRERGNNHSRRGKGNFHGRQGGRSDAGYE